MQVDDVLTRLEKVKHQSGYWTARCPSHADKHPSLSVKDTGEAILLHCHAGCAFPDICTALDVDPKDLFASGKVEKQTIDTVYSYTDVDGSLLFEVVRYWPKDFRQRRPDGDSYIWDLDGVDRVPYRLGDLVAANTEGRWVFLVEGEKDADRLREEGKVATTIAGGAKAWRPDMARWFTGALIAILPDNDAPGTAFAHQAARDLVKVAEAVRVVHLDVPARQDVSNWLISHDVAELEILVRGTVNWTGTVEVTSFDDGFQVRWPDVGYEADFGRIVDKDDALVAEVSIRDRERVIHRGRLNLLASRSVASLANQMTERAPDVEWRELINEAIIKVTDRYREGDPLLYLPEFQDDGAPRWLLEPYLETEGVTVLYAAGGTGKGWLALAIALCIASGEPLLGHSPLQRGPVVYLDWEASERDTARRVAMLARGVGLEPPPLYYRKEYASLPSTADALSRHLERVGAVAAVVDSKGMASGGAPESAEDTLRLFAAIRKLRVPILVVDHTSKAAQQGQAKDLAFGSVYTTNAARLTWSATARPANVGELRLALTNRKANNGPLAKHHNIVFTWQQDTTLVSLDEWTPAADPDLPDPTAADQITTLLIEAGPMLYGEISKTLSMKEGTIKSALSRGDTFDKLPDGRWAVQLPDTLPDTW